jgi:hypothetical protein
MLDQDLYLVDILDSAQEACSYMWVNGEKYVFSSHVTDKGCHMYSLLYEIISCAPRVSNS